MSHQALEGAPLLQVEDLAVTFHTPRGTFRAIRNASLTVHRGELVGLVGESGCGKSTLAFAVMGYLPDTADVGGSLRFEGNDISGMSDAELRELRGNRIAMVYQDPATSLGPDRPSLSGSRGARAAPHRTFRRCRCPRTAASRRRPPCRADTP